ncbi:YcnI family protein [Vogesella sp. AC12]|uniref:YcnI family copper-binding membrane protein n=1 Tax=Vogesella sp. AC12 TaxID=2950550 RepID=UPI00210A5A5B|nr:YcnI family protein [Vogesella sp. AC12]MCQ4145733.1 YcnI family protein [Vogesella sp. AC12]
MKSLLLALGLLLASGTTLAHVTLESRDAVAGSSYKGVLRLPHGCNGSATTSVRVQLPDGFRLAKPMPKAGWQLQTVRAAVSPFDNHGQTVREDVREIVWSGGQLRDDFYDEFVFRGTLPDRAGETAWFKVIQQCGTQEIRWQQLPQDGGNGEFPATSVKLQPAPAAAHVH